MRTHARELVRALDSDRLAYRRDANVVHRCAKFEPHIWPVYSSLVSIDALISTQPIVRTLAANAAAGEAGNVVQPYVVEIDPTLTPEVLISRAVRGNPIIQTVIKYEIRDSSCGGALLLRHQRQVILEQGSFLTGSAIFHDDVWSLQVFSANPIEQCMAKLYAVEITKGEELWLFDNELVVADCQAAATPGNDYPPCGLYDSCLSPDDV